jgi:hypothetical protein
MNIIRPTAIDSIVSSNVPETDYAAWSAATTYAIGERCIVVATHKVYESLQAGNLNHYPPDTIVGATPYWLEVGATNRWKMIDGQVSTQTVNADSIVLSFIVATRINSLALLEVDALSVTVAMRDTGSNVVYSSAKPMDAESWIQDWYAYFFEPIISKTEAVFLDIPNYAGGTVTVTIANAGDVAKCGMVVVGIQSKLGDTLWTPKISIFDYSQKTTDTFGNTILLQRSYAKLLTVDLLVYTNQVDAIRRILSECRSTPMVWIGSELFSSTIIFGFYRSFSIVLSGPMGSSCALDIEGLI